MPELFSFFKYNVTGTAPYREYTIEQAVRMIRSDAAKDDVERLRKATDPATRKVIKKSLSYFTFSGTFKQRKEAGLIQHSGIICLDFDNLQDIAAAKQMIINLPFALACFVSPSGNGLKALVRINPELHAESFVALDWFFQSHQLTVDASGIDVCRACFMSHDPECYYNPDATVYQVNNDELPAIREYITPVDLKPKLNEVEQDKTLKVVEYVTAQIEEQGIDMTEDYQNWMYIFFALSTLGEPGREFLHRISQFNSGYSRKETDYKFNNAVRKSRFTTPAKFFDLAKAAGVDIKLPKTLGVVQEGAKNTTVAVMPAPEAKAPTKPKGDYVLLNERHGEPVHLVTNDALISELVQKDYPNILHSIQRFNDASASKIRVISNNVRLVSRQPADDFDLCDMIINMRFTLAINLIGDEYQNYSNYLSAWYLQFKGTTDQADHLQSLCEHISYFSRVLDREMLCTEIGKLFKIPKATILSEVNGFKAYRDEQVQVVQEDDCALPKWINIERFYGLGFDWHVGTMAETGIYFNEKGLPRRLTNFVLTPLIHVYTKEEIGNRRLTELQNGYLKTVIELPTKAFTSMEAFDNIITSEGAFFTLDGFSKSHLNKLKAFYLGEYPKCFELNTLGWQPEGFFSFSNVIYKNELVEYNHYGFAEVDGQNFLSMGASSALDGVRAEDDIYKNDKYLKFNQAEIDFKRWCELMVKVYPDHGMMGVTFAIMSAFKDVLFKRNNNFPMLYAYGPVGSGKSKFGESVCNLFLHDKPMFNLNQGTDYSFFSELGMFRNVPVGLNEFDENAIKEEWFRALKGAFDGEGRKKGAGRNNKTKTQEIHAAVILIGQYLSTKDDNSVLSRTLPCKFTTEDDRSPERIALFDELKLHEKKGISSMLCDILQHRKHMADHFNHRFVTVTSELKAAVAKTGVKPLARVMENYTAALTTVSLMGEKLNLGFAYDTFLNYAVAEIQKLSGIMGESNSLSTFWKTVEFLLDQNIIESGWHYKVKAESELRISAGRDDSGKTISKTLSFEEPKKLLYLRLNTIHTLYAKEIRNVTGKVGQNEQTILTYMKDQKYYLGSSPAGEFKDSQGNKKNTSSYVFDYDMLGVNLETFKEEKQDPEVTIDGQLFHDPQLVDIIGTPMLKFTLFKDESYFTEDGKQRIEKHILTYCHSPETAMINALRKGTQVKLTGTLKISGTGHRAMQVIKIELTEIFTPTELPEGDIAF